MGQRGAHAAFARGALIARGTNPRSADSRRAESDSLWPCPREGGSARLDEYLDAAADEAEVPVRADLGDGLIEAGDIDLDDFAGVEADEDVGRP